MFLSGQIVPPLVSQEIPNATSAKVSVQKIKPDFGFPAWKKLN